MPALQYALTQGGLAVVVVILVWSYRRDFVRMFDAQQTKFKEIEDDRNIMATLVRDVTKAITESTAATWAQREAIERQKEAIEHQQKATDRQAQAFELLIDRRRRGDE